MIKQRLIGFLVIIALTIIFWPIVFVAPMQEDDFELPVFEMPPKPDITPGRVVRLAAGLMRSTSALPASISTPASA